MNQPVIKSKSTRNASLDIIRITAIAAVVMIHVSAQIVEFAEFGSSEYIWSSVFNSLAHIGVPFFLMTSGALMLNEDKPFYIKELFFKRLSQLLLLLLVWSMLYAIHYQIVIPLLNGNPINVKQLILAFLMGHYHLWYLYMQIGLYLTLPFLKAFVCKKNKNLILLYLGISLLAQFSIPMLNSLAMLYKPAVHLINLIEQFHLDFFTVYVSYFLAGWYLSHIGISRKRNRNLLYFASFASLLLLIAYVNSIKDFKNAFAIEGLLSFIFATGAFLMLTNISRNVASNHFLSLLSKASFGIYIVHIAILDVVVRLLPKTIFTPIYMLLCWLIVFGVSFAATYVLSKIPVLKKMVRM